MVPNASSKLDLANNRIFDSVLETIGKTPLVALDRLTKELDGRILAKIEYFNPGFSKKDRIGLQLIEEAENEGLLSNGNPVIELTSGNTGTGLAIACAIKGYQFIAVMSKGNSIERARMMEAFGAQVVRVDQAEGSPPGQVSGEDLKLVEIETNRLTKELNAFRADQFQLEGNWRAHYLYTGPEIIQQSGGKIDAYCDFVGSAGSFVGVTKSLKEYNTHIKSYIVEPTTASVLSGGDTSNPNHKIQGGGYSMVDLKFLKEIVVDGYISVSNAEAIEYSRQLARLEGIFGGFSSGANVAAAVQLLKTSHKGQTIVVLICDSGLKYLSTDLFA